MQYEIISYYRGGHFKNLSNIGCNEPILKKDFTTKGNNSFNKKFVLKKFDDAARVVQKFFLYAKLKNKFANFNLNLITTFKGSNVLYRTLSQNLLKFVFGKLKQEARRRLMIKFLMFLRNKKLKQIYFAFRKLKNFVNVKTFVLNVCAKRIQDKFRCFKNKIKWLNIVNKKRKLKILFRNLYNLDKLSLENSFKSWRRTNMLNTWNCNAFSIQNFLRKNLVKRKLTKKEKIKLCLKNLFRDYFILKQFKPYMKNFVALETFTRASFNMRKHYFYLVNRRLNEFIIAKRNDKFKKIMNKQMSKIKKYTFISFIDYHTLARKIEAVDKLRKSFLMFKLRQLNKMIKSKVGRILKELENKNDKKLQIYFRKWKKNAIKLKLTHSTYLITAYMKEHLNKLKCERKWTSLFNLLKLKSNLENIRKLIKYIKFTNKFILIQHLFNNKNSVNTLSKLKRKCKSVKLISILKNIYKKCVKGENYINKLVCMNTWKQLNVTKKLQETASKRIFQIINKNRSPHSVVIFSLKKNLLSRLLKRLVLLKALAQIKQRKDNKVKIQEKFCNNLISAKLHIEQFTKKEALNKVYVLYIYKILSNLIDKVYTPYKTNCSILFFNQLINIQVIQSEYSYSSEYTSTRKGSKRQPTFKEEDLSKQNKLSLMSQRDKKIYVVSPLFSLIENARVNNLRFTFELIKLRRNGSILIEKFENVVENSLPYEKFFSKVKAIYLYKLKTPILLKACKNLLRKYFLLRLNLDAFKVSRITSIMYIIKLINMHRVVAKRKLLRIILTKWSFCAHMRRLTKKKMTALYRSMHMTYLKTAKELFNEGEPDYFAEFEKLSK